LFTALAGLEAATVSVSLAADVFGHVVVQHFAANFIESAWLANTRNAEASWVSAGSLKQSCFEGSTRRVRVTLNWSTVTKAAHLGQG